MAEAHTDIIQVGFSRLRLLLRRGLCRLASQQVRAPNTQKRSPQHRDGDGLIVDFKVYACRSAIVEIVQDMTGRGPYKESVSPQS
ncbi:hypothetical protein F5X99DRAFT_382562 [Biscogniauxia marginata]|nr:hypothetical protein F5X99DRAFT_382562 [Biscogniauxia marginata]